MDNLIQNKSDSYFTKSFKDVDKMLLTNGDRQSMEKLVMFILIQKRCLNQFIESLENIESFKRQLNIKHLGIAYQIMSGMKADQYMTEKRIGSQSCEEKEIYDYLFMRFYQLHSQSSLHINNSKNQSTPLIQQLYSCAQHSSIMDLCLQSPLRMSMLDLNGNFNDENHKAKRIILVQVLVNNYPILFSNPQNEDISFENVIFKAITEQSLLMIGDMILSNQNRINDEIFELMNDQLNFFILTVAIHKKLNIKTTPIQEVYTKLHNSIQNLISSINLSSNLKNVTFDVLKKYLWNAFDGQKLTQQQQVSQMYIKQFQSFKIKYRTCQTAVFRCQNIISLHYLQQNLLNSRKQPLFNLKYISSSFCNQFTYTTANFYNQLQSQNQYFAQINSSLLKSFIKQPYQTSLFILFKLLSDCGIRNLDKIFIKNPNDSRKFLLVNPLTFLLVNPKSITRLNAESFSLSLWIIMEVWINNLMENEQSKKQGLTMPQKNFLADNDLSTQNNRDPRQIFRIKKDFYPIPESQATGIRVSQTYGKKKTQEQLRYLYKSDLRSTIMIYLLSLQVETTILKYYPIEYDLIINMAEISLLPSVLLKSPFAMKTVSSPIDDSQNNKTKTTCHIDEQILQRIQKAQTVDQIQRIQELISETQSNHLSNHQNSAQKQSDLQVFQSEYNQWLLPWMSLIENKFIYSKMIGYPKSLELGLKLAERRPNTFYKIYQHSFMSQILSFIMQREKLKGYEIQNSEEKQNKYKMKGNRNVRMKKIIQYGEQRNSNSIQKKSLKKNKSKQERICELKTMRKLLDMHRGKGLDQNIYNNVELTLTKLQSQITSTQI